MNTFDNPQQDQPPVEPSGWPQNPWLSIWTRPRGTIRAIVRLDPEKHVILLAALAGVGQVLDRASTNYMGDDASLLVIFFIALIGGSIGGIISLYISGAILSWLGGLFGGQASAVEVRSAIAWASVPLIWAMLLWIPELALYGSDMFTSVTPRIDNQPWALLVLGLVEIVIAIWAIVIFLKCLGEVHGFSAWKALGVSILPGVVIFLFVFGCLLLTGGF